MIFIDLKSDFPKSHTSVTKRKETAYYEFRQKHFYSTKKGDLFTEVSYKLGIRNEGRSKAVTFPSLLKVIKGYFRLLRDYYFKKNNEIENFSEDSITAKRKS